MKKKNFILLAILLYSVIYSKSINASAYARNTLIIGQTLQGAAIGFTFLNSPLGFSSALLGFSSAYVLSDNTLKNSTSLAINSASLWADIYGYSLGWVLSKDDSFKFAASSLLGILGTTAAAVYSSDYETSSGDLALMNASILWGTVLTLELAAFLSPKPSGRAKYVVLFALTSSMIGGYFLAKK